MAHALSDHRSSRLYSRTNRTTLLFFDYSTVLKSYEQLRTSRIACIFTYECFQSANGTDINIKEYNFIFSPILTRGFY